MNFAHAGLRRRLVPPIEIYSSLELEAADMREALLALEYGYNKANILSMSPRVQELIEKLASPR